MKDMTIAVSLGIECAVTPARGSSLCSANKTDQSDAKGMLEAYRNKDIKAVPVKSNSRNKASLLHRVRSSWAGSRTARINMIRGLLRELGIFIRWELGKSYPGSWNCSKSPIHSFPTPFAYIARSVSRGPRL